MQTSFAERFPLFAGLSEADPLQQLPHRLLSSASPLVGRSR